MGFRILGCRAYRVQDLGEGFEVEGLRFGFSYGLELRALHLRRGACTAKTNPYIEEP